MPAQIRAGQAGAPYLAHRRRGRPGRLRPDRGDRAARLGCHARPDAAHPGPPGVRPRSRRGRGFPESSRRGARRERAAGARSGWRASAAPPAARGCTWWLPSARRAIGTRSRAWCRAFAETMEAEEPDRYVSSVPKVEAPRPHPGRLAAQRPGLDRRRLVLAARPARRHRRHAARLAGGDGRARPGGLHRRHRAAAAGEAESRPLGGLRRRAAIPRRQRPRKREAPDGRHDRSGAGTCGWRWCPARSRSTRPPRAAATALPLHQSRRPATACA